MIINPIKNIYTNFNGRREDNNYLKKLSTSNKAPINENMQINLINILDTLSNDPSTQNIKLLLQTAQNLNYGVKNKSEFKNILLSNSVLKNNKKLSNEDWETRLKNSTQKALLLNKTSEKPYLEKQFKKIFNHKIPLTNEQINILNLRKNILSSKTIKIAKNSPRLLKIKQNLDYFIFSSEISTDDKIACLEKFSYFLSSKYLINPQLRNKKLQVFDEMLNDIIIKRPDEVALSIKSVNQKYHGMCAAIAATRKLAAYIDKPNYVESILEELNSSKKMMVYDITQIGSNKKVPIEKIYIDFDAALKQGYRIIDASSTQWMQNAKLAGDGSTKAVHYQAFDFENYGIFRDSFWLANFPENLSNVHKILISAIKAKEFAKDVENNLQTKKILTENFNDKDNKKLTYYSSLRGALGIALKDFAPSLTNEEINNKISRILALEEINKKVITGNYSSTNKDSKFAINPNLPDELKKEKIKLFLTQNIPNIQISKEKFNNFYRYYTETINTKRNLSTRNTLPYKASEYKDLFNFGVAYKKLIEYSLNDPEYTNEMHFSLGLPIREKILLSSIENNIDNIKTDKDKKSIEDFSKILHIKNDKNTVLEELEKLKRKFLFFNNNCMDDVCKDLGLDGKKGLALSLLLSAYDIAESGKKSSLAEFAEIFNTNATSDAIKNKIITLMNNIDTNPSDENINKIFTYFKIENMSEFLVNLAKLLIHMQKNGEVDILLFKILGENILENETPKNLNKILKKAEQINKEMLDLEDKFRLPDNKKIILRKLEKKEEILTDNEIKELGNKFLEISQYRDIRDEATLKNKKIKNINLYLFTKKQKESLNKIRKSFYQSQKYVNNAYYNLNKNYSEDLDELYRHIGRDNGSLWVSEEGYSGLYSYETIKVLERITGKPFYIESDFKKAIKKIKEGVGGGEIMTNVRDYGYSGHAQYITSITDEKYIDPKTKETKNKEIVWHDNSWGHAERENSWVDEKGFERTNYNNAVGGPNGYILRKNDMTGWDTEYMLYGTGVNSSSKKNLRSENLEKIDDETYSMFREIILPGESDLTSKNISKIVSSLKNASVEQLNILRKKILAGEFPEISKYTSNYDKNIYNKYKELEKALEQINSKEDFDKLPDNNELKIIFRKVSLIDTPIGQANKDLISMLITNDDINRFEKKLLNKYKSFALSYFGGNIDLLKAENYSSIINDYIYDFQEKYNYPLGDLSNNLEKALDIQASEINNPNSLINIYKKNINNLIDENVPNKRVGIRLKNYLNKIINTTFEQIYDENLIINDKDFKPILKLIDNKFNPRTDDEVKEILKKLRTKNTNELKTIIQKTTLDNFGIKFENPYHYLRSVKAKNNYFENEFYENSFIHYASILYPDFSKPKITLGNKYEPEGFSTSKSINVFYRNLYIHLSNIEIQKEIKREKEIALRDYSAHASFPRIKNYTDSNICELVGLNLNKLTKCAFDYQVNLKSQQLLLDIEKFINVYDENRKIYPQEYNENILPILINLTENTALETITPAGNGLVTQILAIPQANYDLIQEKLKLLNNEFKEIDFKNIYTYFANSNTKINEAIDRLISQIAENFILPRKKQQDYKNLLRAYSKEAIRNGNTKKLQNIISEITDFSTKYSPLKNPTLLLNEYVKLLIDSKENNNKQNEALINNYQQKLELLLDAANLNELEFKILNAVRSGTLYEFKNYLNDIDITKSDGTITSLSSDEGIHLLFKRLYNPNDEASMDTINLLCKHTGLSERVFDVINKKANFNIYQKYFQAFSSRINNIYNDSIAITETFNNQKYNYDATFNEILKNYVYDLKEIFKNNSNSKAFHFYTKALIEMYPEYEKLIEHNKQIDPENFNRNYAEIMEYMFTSLHKKAMNSIIIGIDSSVNKVNDYLKGIYNDLNILNALELSKYSQKYKEQKQVIEKLTTWYKYSQNMANDAKTKLEAIYDADYDTDNV